MKNFRIISLFAVLLCIGFSSCSDWTEAENIEVTVRQPWEQDPALWEEYTAALRAYKQSEHFIVCARLFNSPDKAFSEQDFMRCLPDSLDFVMLENAANFSKFDREDMPVMRQKGTKVLYRVDCAALGADLADEAKLNALLDKAVATVRTEGLDGFSFTADPLAPEAAAAAVAKLAGALSEGRLLVFEGNPLSLSAEDRARVDYIILNTQRLEHVQDIKLQVLKAIDYAKVPASQLLLAAEANARINDEDRTEFDAIEEMARCVIELGPLSGMGVFDIGDDYYSSDMNFRMIRRAIQMLNPAK